MLTRTPSSRRLGKLSLFLARGISPRVAWWLAKHDAPKRFNYRGVRLEALQSAWQAALHWRDLAVRDGNVHAEALGLAFQSDDLVQRSFATLHRLRARGFALSRDGEGLLVENDTWRLRLTTAEHANMAQEIFVEGCYDFQFSGSWVVLDIGANIGLASLFFAARPWVESVIAFEPFVPTADEHAANVQLNPRLARKIELRRVGLADENVTREVDYHRELSGSMAVNGLGAWRGAAERSGTRVTIALRSAAETLQELRATIGSRRLLAKIDCEGSEYAILRDWEKAGLLPLFDAIVMEWHAQRPDALVRQLTAAGFALHVRPLVADASLGLIIAWRDRP